MNKLRPLLILLAVLTLALLPFQTVQGQGFENPQRDPGVIIGSSYILKSGETVSGGMVVIGGSAVLETGSTFFGDLVVIGGSTTLQEDAEVNGAVVTIGGSLTVNTEVKGDLVSIGGPTLLQETAHIRGDVIAIGGPVQKTEGAQIDGELIDNPTPPTQPEVNIPAVDTPRFDFVNPFWEAFGLLMRSAAFGLLAGFLALFMPEQFRRVSNVAMRQPLRATGMGILTYIVFIVVMVALALFSVLIVTLLLTIPLFIIVPFVLVAGWAFGWFALGAEIGVRLVGLFNREWPLPVSAVLGTFLLTLVSGLFTFDFIICFGWVVPVFLSLLAVGAVATTRFGTQAAAFPASQAEAEYVPPAETL